MNAGELDKRVQLLRRFLDTDQLGARRAAYAPSGAPVWAKVEWAAGGEAFSTDGARRVATHKRKFTIRYRPDVEPTWRLEFDGATYDITDVQDLTDGGANKGRRRFLVLLAEAQEVSSGEGS